MIARLRRVLDGLDERLTDEMDRRAASEGWTVQRTGWLRLGREYVRPEQAAQNGDVGPNAGDEDRNRIYPGYLQVGTTGLVKAWRDPDSASGPRHSTQGA